MNADLVCPNCGFVLKPKAVGRPRRVDDAKIEALRKQGLSYRAIAYQLECSEGAVRASLKRTEKGEGRK